MLEGIRNILEKTKNANRSSYIFNAVNAIISALQNPIILLVITRTNGVYDAGVFSIAFAIATLMLYVGLYGLRRFQSSDMNEIQFQRVSRHENTDMLGNDICQHNLLRLRYLFQWIRYGKSHSNIHDLHSKGVSGLF